MAHRPRDNRNRRDRPERDTTRVNERIRVPQVLVIDENGQQIGVMKTQEAQRYAAARELDLVEVAAEAKPPVCRVLNYSKYRYEQERRAKLARRNQNKIETREVKLSVKIADNDLNTKIRHTERFLGRGDQVKLSLRFKGREITHPNLAREILQRVAEAVAEVGRVEQGPTQSGREMSLLLVPLTRPRSKAKAEKARRHEEHPQETGT